MPIGVSDFEGRSFRGWHHHTSLVSVAHAASLFTEAQEAEYARLRPPAVPVPLDRERPAEPTSPGLDRALRVPTV